jgi:hypothetical protein
MFSFGAGIRDRVFTPSNKNRGVRARVEALGESGQYRHPGPRGRLRSSSTSSKLERSSLELAKRLNDPLVSPGCWRMKFQSAEARDL